MGRMTYTCGIVSDGQSGVLEMQEDGKPLAHMIFDGAELEQLIHNLGRIRAGLKESVSPELDPGARIAVEQFPAWKIPANHSGPEGTVLLALRHQGMGWLGFLLEELRAKEVAESLILSN